jgi:hypothetical protein
MYLAYMFLSEAEEKVGTAAKNKILDAARKRFADELPDNGVGYENMGSCSRAADRFRREYRGWNVPY